MRFFYHAVTAPPPTTGPRASHCRGFVITLRHTTIGRTFLDDWSARRRDLYLTTQNTHNRQTFMPPGGIRTHNCSKRAAADPRLRPRGHWDRQFMSLHYIKLRQVSFVFLHNYYEKWYLIYNVNSSNFRCTLNTSNFYSSSSSLGATTSIVELFWPSQHTRVGTLIVATIYLQLIQNRYMFRSFTVLHLRDQIEVTRA